MIEELKNDDIIVKCGGRFKLTALIQRRWLQLLRGARPLIPDRGLTMLEVVVKEIAQGKIEITTEPTDAADEFPPPSRGF